MTAPMFANAPGTGSVYIDPLMTCLVSAPLRPGRSEGAMSPRDAGKGAGLRWHTLLAIDSDRWAAETYRWNFPSVRVECGPVSEYIDKLPEADVILGGPPCQPFSDAGENEGEEDERDCIPDFVAAVAKVRPRMFLMENVRGLLKEKHLPYFGRVLNDLESLGYSVDYRMLDAVSFGVPQFRERVWVWGIRKGLNVARHWPKPTHVWPWPDQPCMFGGDLLPAVTVGQSLGLDGHERVIGAGSNPHFIGDVRTERDITDEPSPTLPAGDRFGNVLPKVSGCVNPRELSPERPARTVTAKNAQGTTSDALRLRGSEVYVRRLTPWECARLQSVPDDFAWPEKISKTAMYKIVGNGWACGHAAHFSRAMAEADPDARSVIDLFCGGGLCASGWHGRAWSYRPAESEVA